MTQLSIRITPVFSKASDAHVLDTINDNDNDTENYNNKNNNLNLNAQNEMDMTKK